MDDSKKFFDSELLSNIMDEKNDEALSMLQKLDDIQNMVDNTGSTLLHYAARYGNAIVAQYLIDAGCNIDCQDASKNSPLMLAVKYERLDTIKVLLNANVDINLRSYYGRTPLESVLQQGVSSHSHIVTELFLNRIKVLCHNDDTLIANRLMEANCNLIEAIRLNRPEVVRLMIEKGCSIEDRDVDCNTTLHVAVELMNLEIIKLLVEHGARINVRGYEGMTPILKYDMKFKDTSVKLDILRYLLDKGASLTIQDLNGNTPLTVFLHDADREILDVIMQYDVDLCCLNNSHPNSALHYLVENTNPGILEAIRGKHFEVNIRNSLGLTPLLMAVKNYDFEKIEFLIEHGADVNAQSPDGYTPLILLFVKRLEDEKNVSRILHLLLEHEADIEIKFESDMTILDLAEKNNYYFRVKPVIAKMVMYEILDKPIDKLIRDKVTGNLIFEHHYEKCKEQIRQMRHQVVHESVNLYKLLFEPEDKLVMYARNDEFELKFRKLYRKLNNVDMYFKFILKKRVVKAIKIAELKKKAVITLWRIVTAITDLPISNYHIIFYEMVEHLDNQDLETLDQL